MGPKSRSGGGDRLCQTSPIPRSPDGDKKLSTEPLHISPPCVNCKAGFVQVMKFDLPNPKCVTAREKWTDE